MRITCHSLRRLVKEAIQSDKILSERPWSVEVTFSLGGGVATDSEGEGPDGFALHMKASSATASVVIDTYWNPSSGDSSGNSIRFEVEGEDEVEESYVPFRMDDGKKHRLIISNSPVFKVMTVGISSTLDDLPIVYLVSASPFQDEDDIDFEIKPLGNGEVAAEITGHVNL